MIGDDSIIKMADSVLKKYGGGTPYKLEDMLEIKMIADTKKVTDFEDKVELNDKKLGAYAKFIDLLKSFKNSVDGLRKPLPSFATSSEEDVFSKRTIILENNTTPTIDPVNYVGAAAYSGAIVGEHTLSITSLATAKKQSSSTIFTSDITSVTEAANGVTSGLFSAGTMQINGINVTISEGSSLKDIASTINAYSSSTNVQATVIKRADNDYRFILQSTKTGISSRYNITDATGILSQISFNLDDAGTDSSFTFDGITMTREFNEVNDIFSDNSLRLSLYRPTAGDTIKLTIEKDLSQVNLAIKKFMGTYNNIMTFAYEQQERDPSTGRYKDTSYLGQEEFFHKTISDITNYIATMVSGISASEKSSLGQIGIMMGDYTGDPSKDGITEDGNTTKPAKNALMFRNNSEQILQDSLLNNFEEVRRIFQFDFNPGTSNLIPYTRTNGLSATNFTINIDTSLANDSNGRQQKVKVTIGTDDYYPIFVPNNEDNPTTGYITGIKNTPIDGLTMIYNGDGSDIFTVNLTQGVADKLFNLLDDALSNNPRSVLKTNAQGEYIYDTLGNPETEDLVYYGIVQRGAKELVDKNAEYKRNIEDQKERNEVRKKQIRMELSAIDAQIAKYQDSLRNLEMSAKAMFSDKG